ncbi:nucleotidyltransferase domain-containing protein [Chryseosolibacter indicus]|uniref:Nucleotidyltransferase domain-containing protein n=1 Tax=Chryseosolibacter indicus TaxID=2782351 RepID=A0ABS5VUQ4_9BACT|nr:nucleotidyltransferase domain-containing protein [Chryseosolibacter indicus]MBT1705159.1 nucleotidyltransferase domain-containing protein [Chryseosolibacter indicus]
MYTLSKEKQTALKEITTRLKGIKGIQAVVLGGSYAAGRAHEKSDLDLGLYYREDNPFEIEDIRSFVKDISFNENPVVTGFYDWGPWVNGGAWMETKVGKVDFIYRNTNQVQKVIDDAGEGKWHHSYDQQPPFGFRSTIYLAEIECSQILFDNSNVLTHLKEQVRTYPEKLYQTIVGDCLWLAEFTLQQSASSALLGDVYSVVGDITRALNYIVQALFALNKKYQIGDKHAISIVETFEKKPSNFKQRVQKLLASPGLLTHELTAATKELTSIWLETVYLTNGVYNPKFTLH